MMPRADTGKNKIIKIVSTSATVFDDQDEGRTRLRANVS